MAQQHVRGPATETLAGLLSRRLRVHVMKRRPIVPLSPAVRCRCLPCSRHNAGRVDIQPARTVCQDVRSQRAGERLAPHDDGLKRGLERRAPARPLLCFGGDRLVDGCAFRDLQMRARRVARDGDRLASVSHDPSGLVDSDGQVHTLGEARSVLPYYAIADLKACIFDGAREPVVRPRAPKCEQVAPRLEHTQSLPRPREVSLLGDCGVNMRPVLPVKFLTHESQKIRRVADDRVHTLGGHRTHRLDTVRENELDGRARGLVGRFTGRTFTEHCIPRHRAGERTATPSSCSERSRTGPASPRGGRHRPRPAGA